jgi:hypothetical protein
MIPNMKAKEPLNDPARHKEVLLALNVRLNELISREVGVDDGSHMPGNPERWRKS